MRVATWNIGGGLVLSEKGYDLENVPYFTYVLQKIQPDIICLQEVHESDDGQQTSLIAAGLGLKYFRVQCIASSHLKEGVKLGIGIVSRYPIISSTFHTLRNPMLSARYGDRDAVTHDKGFIEAIIHIDNRCLRVLSGHMVPFWIFSADFMDDRFADIRAQIVRIISGTDVPTVVGVDLNFNDAYSLLPEIFEKKYICLGNDEETTPAGNTFDKIILSSEFSSPGIEIVKGKADHFLCFADIHKYEDP